MQGTSLEHPAQVIKETLSLGSTGHLLHKAILPRLGDIEELPNTQKQTQRGSQNGETRKHAPNERTGEISRKRTKLNREKQFTR